MKGVHVGRYTKQYMSHLKIGSCPLKSSERGPGKSVAVDQCSVCVPVYFTYSVPSSYMSCMCRLWGLTCVKSEPVWSSNCSVFMCRAVYYVTCCRVVIVSTRACAPNPRETNNVPWAALVNSEYRDWSGFQHPVWCV